MSSTPLGLIAADFQTALSAAVSAAATSATLQSIVDSDSVNLANGTYVFTVDGNNSSKEYFVATLTGTSLSAIQSISRQGALSSGFARAHRTGATVTITDHATLRNLCDIVRGSGTLNHSAPIKYDASVSPSLGQYQVVDWDYIKAYADGLAIAGAPDSSTTTKGISKMSVAPVSATAPIAVGDNDPRVPTQSENDALAGGSSLGTPSSSNKFTTEESMATYLPVGTMFPYGGISSPTGFLLCDGSAVSRTTYATLFGILNPSLGTVTISIASPGVVTYTSHGLATGDGVYLTTTGALPTGLSINTKYWIIKNDANTFWLASSLANALAGTKINTSGSQSGTHTAKITPYGVGDGSTTFNLPNTKGVVLVGKNQSDSEFSGLGQTGGEKTHTLITAEIPSHNHGMVYNTSGGASSTNGFQLTAPYAGSAPNTSSTGGDGAHNNLQPYISVNYIIKY